MTTPPQDARERAERIVDEWWSEQSAGRSYAWSDLYDRIASALTPPTGHVRDEHAVDRKVLGTLPLTVDGCVIGEHAEVFMPVVNAVIEWHSHMAGIPASEGKGWKDRHVFHRCYSSKEAATSAKGTT